MFALRSRLPRILSRLKLSRLNFLHRIRSIRNRPTIAWPPVPAGVHLSPSDVDIAAYARAPLALTWSPAVTDTLGWQSRARAKLSELLGLDVAAAGVPVMGQGATMADGLRRQTYYLPTAANRHVPVTVVWDFQKEHVELPLMICLQGHTSGAHISWGEVRAPIDVSRTAKGGDFAVQAVRHGHVAVCVEQIAFGERREQQLEHRWEHTCVDAANRALLLGRTVLGDRVVDVMSVIGWLQGDPELTPRIDAKRIRTMGNSAGGETALFAAALDARVEAVMASGCVGNWRQTSGLRKTCPDTVIPGVLNWLEYSDVLALCAPKAVLVVSGSNDHLYPFHLAEACVGEARHAFDAIGAADRIAAIAGPDGHQFYPELAWPAFFDLLRTSES